jgi:hypothetical protein
MPRVAAFVLLASVGCQKPSADSPEGAFRLFAEAMRKSDVKTAFGLLSEKSKATLGAKSKALAEASKGTLKDEPSVLLVSPRRASPLVSVAVQEADATRAVLTVTTCREALDVGGTCPKDADVQERVTMVKEVQRWAVDLPELVTP